MLKGNNIILRIFQVIWFFIVLFLGVNVAHYGDNWFAGSSIYWGLVGQAIPMICGLIIGLIVLIWFLYKKRKERKRQELKQEIKAEILQELGM